jgi:hypothetical protein
MQLPTTQFTFAREMPVLHFGKTQQKYIRFQPLAELVTKIDHPRRRSRNAQRHRNREFLYGNGRIRYGDNESNCSVADTMGILIPLISSKVLKSHSVRSV